MFRTPLQKPIGKSWGFPVTLVFWALMSRHSINIRISWKSPKKKIIKIYFCEHWTYITKSVFISKHIVCFVNWTYSSNWQYTAIQFAWFSHTWIPSDSDMLIAGLCMRQTDVIGHCIMSCCSFSDWRYEHCILSWSVKLKVIKPQKDMLRLIPDSGISDFSNSVFILDQKHT